MRLQLHLSLILLLLIPTFSVAQSLIVESKTVQPGTTFTVDVQMPGFPLVSTLQGSINWNGDDLSMGSVIATSITNLGFSGGFPSEWFFEINNGSLEFSWTDPSFIFGLPTGEQATNDILFTLEFTALAGLNTSTQITVSSVPLLLEFATPFFVPISNIQLVDGTILIGGAGFPVTWLGLDAKTTDEGVAVSWATATELNNDYFEVERVLPNGETTIIGRMDAAGTADSERNYSMMDPTAPQGQLKYRIKQVDFDGGYSYSSFVEVVNVQEESLVYPNPTNGTLFIALPAADVGKVEVTVRDLTGRTVFTTSSEGESIIELSIEDQPTGWYLAETISSSGTRSETRVLKMN